MSSNSLDDEASEEDPPKGGDGEGDVWASSVRCLGYLSSVNLLVAVCLGMYVRYEVSDEPMILVIVILGLFVLGIGIILYYYFAMESASMNLFHLWFGFLQGLLCFLNSQALEEDVKEQVTNYLLLASVSARALWAVTERVGGSARYRATLLTSEEVLELLGFAIASTTLPLYKSAALLALTLALAATVVDLRMKSLLALPNLVCFTVVTAVCFFQALAIRTNPFALGCYLGRLLCDPLLDVYFSGLPPTERWQPFLSLGRLWRRLTLLPLTLLEMAFFGLCAVKLSHLELWYLVIPGFLVFGLFWLLCHALFLASMWGFHSKLSECQRAHRAQASDTRPLDRVMGARGMRHFCLVSERMVFFSLLSTVILGAVSWQLSNGLFMGALLVVLPLESLAYGLFHELGGCLGGTCAGYALVVPTCYYSADGQPVLLPPEQVQALNSRSTAALSAMQRLFSHHLIHPFGCDYSTSGLSLAALLEKLRNFLELRTAEGPRHDTYLLYYSGHTLRTGDWALAGGDCLRLDQLLELWRERNAGHCSRLILVLDTDNSPPWVRAVRRVEGLYVAVQGAQHHPHPTTLTSDIETGDVSSSSSGRPHLGDFTAAWADYNCSSASALAAAGNGRPWCEHAGSGGLEADYGVSKPWADYTLHLPTGSDVSRHGEAHFPRVTYPALALANWCCALQPLWACGACLRCVRRMKLAWCPPNVLDTGQGIRLVRS
ncbi:transmembrane protein 168-A [Engraulis encrasicolus]|uniref:transmembrane protein 168-A n=1 Tax=Engraulis encrasicolus TaxID=184585 RepID=UPI002FD3DD13